MSLSTLVMFRIGCDTAGCAAVWPPVGWALDRAVAWQDARAAGWMRDYEQYRCPGCSPRAAVVAEVRGLAGRLTDAQIGARVGLSRAQVQALRAALGIPGRRVGRPAAGRAA